MKEAEKRREESEVSAGPVVLVAKLLRNRLLAGIIVAVPLIVTILVLRVGYQAIDSVTSPFLSALGINFFGSGFLATVLLVLALGFMTTNVLGRKLLDRFELLLTRIPVVAPLYTAVKQALESFKDIKDKRKFRSVAYIEYPSKGCFLIGFVTGNLVDPIHRRPMTTVFVPTSPNPLTGFVIAVPDELLIESGLTLEQASKLIVSAGLVCPPPPGAQTAEVGAFPGAKDS